ncbi:MAG: TonB-dependent receptor, partial [Bacteroidota bacterium]
MNRLWIDFSTLALRLSVCCALFLPGSLLAQVETILVRDLGSFRPIPSVNVSILGSEDELLLKGETLDNGQFSLPEKVLEQAKQFRFEHPEYAERILSQDELREAGFQVVLEHESYQLDEVIFVANRHRERKSDIPHQIQVIKAEDIADHNPQTSADLLAQQGQVFVQKSQQGGGSPNLRGFEANKVLLVVDGIRMNNAIYRSGHLQNVISLDPAIVERTEVMFGPGSVIYGSDALGGVMHFYTRQPQLSRSAKRESKTQHFARYHHANRGSSLHSDLNIGYRRWASLTSISINRFGDLRVGQRASTDYPEFGLRPQFVDVRGGQDVILNNPSPHRLRPSAYSQLDFAQKLLFVPTQNISHQLQFQYSTSTNINRFDRLTQLQDSSLRFAEWYYGPQKRLLLSYHLTAYQPTKLYDQLDMITAWQDIEESRVNRTRLSPWRNHRIEDVGVASLNLNLTKTLGKVHELAYGLDMAYNRIASTAFQEEITSGERLSLDTRYPDGGTNWWSGAVYFTHRWEVNRRLILTEGIRWNQISLHSQFVDTSFFRFPFTEIRQSNQALSGNLGIVLKLPRGFRLSAIGSSGFRAPNLDDVAKVFDSQPGNVVVPNPELRPETTYNAELSLSRRFGRAAKLEVVGWYTWYQDAIVLRAATFNGQSEILYEGVLSQVQMNVNARSARIYGLNLNGWWQIADFRLSHSSTYTYGQDLSGGVPLDHIPPLFGRTELQYANGAWKGALSLPYQTWKRPERYSPRDFTNAEFATADGWPAWMVVNLRASYTL